MNATRPVYLSEESYRIWGLDPQQGLPARETVVQRIHPDDRDRVDAGDPGGTAVRKEGTPSSAESSVPTGLSDISKPPDILCSPRMENVVEMLATHIDVTERKRAQEEHERLRQLETDLAHMNRVSIMGELAASLAHEILHPIATARNNARAGMRFLEMSPPNLPEVKEALACIVRDADRAKGIVDRMRDHIKKAPPRSEPFDLNEAIDEVIEMVQSAITKNGVLVRTTLKGSLLVHGDRVQLQQVVLNLILNAIEAMSSVEEGARELSISTRQGQTSDVLVAVQDSGPGIDPERLDAGFRGVLHHKECWNRNGTLDLPVHHHRSWRSTVGRGQSASGRGISVHSARRPAGFMSALHAAFRTREPNEGSVPDAHHPRVC